MKTEKKAIVLSIALAVTVGAALPTFACHCPARPIPYRPPVYACHRHHCHDGVLGATLNLVGSIIGCGRTCCDHATYVVQPTTVVETVPVLARTYYTPSHLTTAMTPLVTVPGVAAGSVQTAPVVPAYCVPTPSRTWVSARYVMRGNVPVWEPGHWVVQ